MKLVVRLVSVAALVAGMGPAFAQSELVGINTLDDRIDDIEEDVADDFERSQDDARFGNLDVRQGLSGSASLSYTGQTGNSESQELALGARIRHASGPFAQTIGFAIDFTDIAGTATKEDVFGVYDATYSINDRFYGFVLGRVQTDGLADTSPNPSQNYLTDAFIGVGPGYRVVNRPDMTWRVQAGVGFSYLEDGNGVTDEEFGVIASSRFYYSISETMFVTNDTDVLHSDTALRVNNDLGVNFKMTDAFSTRVSYLSEYNDARAIRTDNKLGVALVYGF